MAGTVRGVSNGVRPTPGAVTCYRHPDRVAGVGCQRCGRPICPQCMVQAQVGFQCPECAHSRPQQIVHGPAAFGSRSADIVVGKVLIAINVAVYVLTVLVGGSTSPRGWVFENGVTWGPGVAHGEWWRLVTGAFMHGSPLHLLMNMFLLYLLARELEPVLGHLRFGLVYGVSLFGGAVGVMIVSPMDPTLGASGAIFGLMGAMIVLQLRARQNPWSSGIVGLVLLNLVLTFAVPGISVGGHVGGLLAGAVAGLIVSPRRAPAQEALLRDGFLVVTGVLLATLAVVVANAAVGI